MLQQLTPGKVVSSSLLSGPCSSSQVIAVIQILHDCLYIKEDALTILAQCGLAMRGLRPSDPTLCGGVAGPESWGSPCLAMTGRHAWLGSFSCLKAPCVAGYSFTTTFHRPTIWTEPFPPSVVLQPTLPDEDGHVGSRQVEIESTEVNT